MIRDGNWSVKYPLPHLWHLRRLSFYSLSFGLTREAWKKRLSRFLNQNLFRWPFLVQDLGDLRTIPCSEAKQVSDAPLYPLPAATQAFYVPLCMLSLHNARLIHQNTCTRVPLHWVSLQQWSPFSAHPALHCFPLGARRQALFFLSTHSMRPLSFAMTHYWKRRSLSCTEV